MILTPRAVGRLALTIRCVSSGRRMTRPADGAGTQMSPGYVAASSRGHQAAAPAGAQVLLGEDLSLPASLSASNRTSRNAELQLFPQCEGHHQPHHRNSLDSRPVLGPRRCRLSTRSVAGISISESPRLSVSLLLHADTHFDTPSEDPWHGPSIGPGTDTHADHAPSLCQARPPLSLTSVILLCVCPGQGRGR
jgi:hypothetical protein